VVEPPTVMRVSWQPLVTLDPPSPDRLKSPPLRGDLHEHVQMTPKGSRAHTIQLTMHGGWTWLPSEARCVPLARRLRSRRCESDRMLRRYACREGRVCACQQR
jgi:hypothetical protein